MRSLNMTRTLGFHDQIRSGAIMNHFARNPDCVGISAGEGFKNCFFRVWINGVVYGNQFKDCVILLQILVWNVMVIWVGSTFGFALNATKRQRQWSVATVTEAIVSFFASIVTIPIYRTPRAAMTTVAPEIVVSSNVSSKTLQELRLNFFKSIAMPAMSASITFLVGFILVLSLGTNPLIALPAVLGTYVTAILHTRSFL